MIATVGGQDRKIKIWKEVELQGSLKWVLEFQDEADAPLNCIAWAPWEYGMIIAAGTFEGKVHTYQRTTNVQGDKWEKHV